MFHFLSKHKLSLLSLAIVLALGGVVIFSLNRANTEELPPSLPFSPSMFQGLLKVDDERFFMFEESEIEYGEDNSDYDNGLLRTGRDIQFFYSEKDLSVEEITKLIVPQRNNKFVFAYFDPSVRNWYTYPKGPFKDTLELKKSQIDDYIVPAGHAFVIGAERNFETVDLKHGTQRPGSTDFEIEDLTRGWNLLAVKNNTDLQNLISKCDNRVRSMWVQKANNDFEKTEKSYPRLKTGYHLVWFNIGSTNDECFALSASSGGEYEAPCVSTTPVCDSEGVWYENACVALNSNNAPSSVYLADSRGNCIDYSTVNTGNMPASMCNPLSVSPVCGIDGTYYKNLCIAYAENPNFVRADIYTADIESETCDFDTMDLKRPDPQETDRSDRFDFEPNFYKTRTSVQEEVTDGRSDFEFNPRENQTASEVLDNSPVEDFEENEGSVASTGEVVVDYGVQDLFDDNNEEGSAGSEEQLIDPVQGCTSDAPVCSVNGLYFDNICKLLEAGFQSDEESTYNPVPIFNSLGVAYCEQKEEKLEFQCKETQCVYKEVKESGLPLKDAYTTCEIVFDQGHLSCIDFSLPVFDDPTLNGLDFSDEFFVTLDKLYSDRSECCTP